MTSRAITSSNAAITISNGVSFKQGNHDPIPSEVLQKIGDFLDFQGQTRLFLWTAKPLLEISGECELNAWPMWSKREIERVEAAKARNNTSIRLPPKSIFGKFPDAYEGAIYNLAGYSVIPIQDAERFAGNYERCIARIAGRTDVPINKAVEIINHVSPTSVTREKAFAVIGKRTDVSIQNLVRHVMEFQKTDQIATFEVVVTRKNVNFKEAISIAQDIENIEIRERAFSAIVTREDVPFELAISIAKSIENEDIRDAAFSNIARRKDLNIEKAIAVATNIKNEHIQNYVFGVIAENHNDGYEVFKIPQISLQRAIGIALNLFSVSSKFRAFAIILERSDVVENPDEEFYIVTEYIFARQTEKLFQLIDKVKGTDKKIQIALLINNGQQRDNAFSSILKNAHLSLEDKLKIAKHRKGNQNQFYSSLFRTSSIDSEKMKIAFSMDRGQERDQVLDSLLKIPHQSFETKLEIAKKYTQTRQDKMLASLMNENVTVDQKIEAASLITDPLKLEKALELLISIQSKKSSTKELIHLAELISGFGNKANKQKQHLRSIIMDRLENEF